MFKMTPDIHPVVGETYDADYFYHKRLTDEILNIIQQYEFVKCTHIQYGHNARGKQIQVFLDKE
jgi:hypothetical protein